jgi:hypothetical protein
MTPNQQAALDRLIGLAHGNSDQCRKVADFLLAWWNPTDCGAFDLTDLWSVDDAIAADMIEVCRLVASSNSYPDMYGYGEEFKNLVSRWRPGFAWWNGLTEAQQSAWRRRSKPFTPADAYKEWREQENRREQAEEDEKDAATG